MVFDQQRDTVAPAPVYSSRLIGSKSRVSNEIDFVELDHRLLTILRSPSSYSVRITCKYGGDRNYA